MVATLPDLYPLRFEPLLRRYIWGGRRLATHLNKRLDHHADYGESWEIVDRPHEQSTVSSGPLVGLTLRDLMDRYRARLVGESGWKNLHETHVPPSLRGRFPLLIKFIDAAQNLSVQVHPNDQQAAKLDPPEPGKSEAWIILDAQPHSRIYAGLRADVTPEHFEQALRDQSDPTAVERSLNSFPAIPGDCVYIPAGTVHAIGEGILLAEVQQPSDTTYRLFDWQRVDAQGQPRPLHVEQGLKVIDFSRGPIEPCRPTGSGVAGCKQLMSSDHFFIRHWQTDQSQQVPLRGQFCIVVVLAGELSIEGDSSGTPCEKGSTILIPAELPSLIVTPHGETSWLEIGIPQPAAGS